MEHAVGSVSPLWIIPFVLMLASIAIMPFVDGDWWGKNYKYVALGLGAVTAGYYLFGRGESHHVLETLHEYVSFIALVGSLYIVSGGIHIRLKGRSTPNENLAFLAGGALIANLLGTTGASMLLIRPYLRNNKYRLSAYHVVFFIFIVSNIGGALTPIGDPPLFLGYIKGIPFFWITEHTVWPWLIAIVLLLAVFYFYDRRSFNKMPESLRKQVIHENNVTEVTGLHNVLYLAVIIGAVFIDNPPLLREAVMIGAALVSYLTTKKEIHLQNHFNFHPIQEVGWLFIGIFMTMMPALDWLGANAASFGMNSAGGFYWSTGALSGVLDNAPTYLSFLATAMGVAGKNVQSVADVHSFLVTGQLQVVAISVGAVFFGSMTYIGNGPNFMVKAIAEHQGAHMPSFFGYVTRFSLPFLVPVFLIVWLIFF